MPVVLVHGNPETDAIWSELIPELGRSDVLTLSPPGFGAPVPDNFTATSEAYANWLAAQLEEIPAPIDLVGHDWGGGHVARVALEHPELIRSWTMDIAGCFDPEYHWHDRAQVWQTPGAGEAAVAQQLALPKDVLTQGYINLGMSRSAAMSCAQAFNEEMGRCILALYRSAAQPRMQELGAQLPRLQARPGLVIIATEDQYTGGPILAQRSAERAGAQTAVLNGLGHWWMCQDPARGAAALRGFLETLDAH